MSSRPLFLLNSYVTLHVSVWVEMKNQQKLKATWTVTLHVSVWVEIAMQKVRCEMPDGHAPRERVSWNYIAFQTYLRQHRHAPRERVSWNCRLGTQLLFLLRHAPRERVSWNWTILFLWAFVNCHAPRERVSWNSFRNVFHFSIIMSRSTWACELKYQ